jgi:hypothetical protein
MTNVDASGVVERPVVCFWSVKPLESGRSEAWVIVELTTGSTVEVDACTVVCIHLNTLMVGQGRTGQTVTGGARSV